MALEVEATYEGGVLKAALSAASPSRASRGLQGQTDLEFFIE